MKRTGLKFSLAALALVAVTALGAIGVNRFQGDTTYFGNGTASFKKLIFDQGTGTNPIISTNTAGAVSYYSPVSNTLSAPLTVFPQQSPSTGVPYLSAGTMNTEAQLNVARGGTGTSSLTSNGVLYGNGTSAAGVTAAGSSNQVLHANTGSAPTWGGVASADITNDTIVDADINSAAAITRSKIANGTASHVIVNNGSGTLSSEATLAVSRGGLGTTAITGFVAGSGSAYSGRTFSATSPLSITNGSGGGNPNISLGTFTTAFLTDVFSGTWTPSCANIATTSTFSITRAIQTRVGSHVHFSIRGTLTVTSSSGAIAFTCAIGTCNNFSATSDVAGLAVLTSVSPAINGSGVLSAVASSDDIRADFSTQGVSSTGVNFIMEGQYICR